MLPAVWRAERVLERGAKLAMRRAVSVVRRRCDTSWKIAMGCKRGTDYRKRGKALANATTVSTCVLRERGGPSLDGGTDSIHT